MFKNVKLMAIKTKLSIPFQVIDGHWFGSIAKIMAIKILYSDKVMANRINGNYVFIS